MTTDFRALCAELIYELTRAASGLSNRTANDNHLALWAKDAYQAADRARAALAQTEPVAPTDGELWELYELERGEPGDWSWVRDYARAALARWGTPVNPTNQEDYD